VLEVDYTYAGQPKAVRWVRMRNAERVDRLECRAAASKAKRAA